MNTDTPKTDALLRLHRAETEAMRGMGHCPGDPLWLDHCVRQAQELLDHVLQTERDTAEMLELLAEAETMLRHTRCMTEDAMLCPGCSLESRIYALLSKARATGGDVDRSPPDATATSPTHP